MNVPPPILENFYNKGGDDDADDHEQDPYIRWRLATYSDGSPLLICIQGTADVTKEAGARMVALSCPIPTSVVGYSGWILVYYRQHLLPGSVLIVLDKTRSSLDKTIQ